jgi:flagellar basal-body rod protein FlgG
MSGLIESAAAILSSSERRLEVAAHNVSNISTAGYKRQLSFADAIQSGVPGTTTSSELRVRRDLRQGALTQTGNPLDLAISGAGFFQLRAGDALIYSRQGHFQHGPDGSVVTPQGYTLQQAGGGDLIIDRADMTIARDGTVLDGGTPIARIAVYAARADAALEAFGDSHFTAAADAMEIETDAFVRQGSIENSNVSSEDEMVGMLAAVRQSETGARLVQVYDELLGRALSTLGGRQ